MLNKKQLKSPTKIDNRLNKSLKSYSSLATSCDNLQLVVGRRPSMKSNEKYLFQDICHKLKVKKGDRVLSIGVGCGQIANMWIHKAKEMKLKLYFNDFPNIIDRIKAKFRTSGVLAGINLTFIEGVFPTEMLKDLAGATFDCIDIYSVIHCTDKPLNIIKAAVSLLAPGGKLLIGDIPNMDKMGRFLASSKGRLFEARYRRVPVANIPIYSNYKEFTKQAILDGHAHLDDNIVFDILTKYRKKGYDTYLLDQPDALPFCHTREDILIIAPNE